jgi:hypothetical protein
LGRSSRSAFRSAPRTDSASAGLLATAACQVYAARSKSPAAIERSALRFNDHARAMSRPLILIVGRNPRGVTRQILGRNSARKIRNKTKPAKTSRNQKLKTNIRSRGK